MAEFGDSVFANAGDLVAQIAATAGEELRPSDLASTLLVLLKQCQVPVADIDPAKILRIIPRPSKGARPEPGDVLALPVSGEKFGLAVVLTRNRFGTALGLLRGALLSPRPRKGQYAPTPCVPIYTDERLLADGTWRKIDHDEQLLAHFPEDPEIYHSPDLQWPGVELGEFGAAENSAGRLRFIDATEARTVGILDGSYRQARTGEEVQDLLSELQPPK
ncbi:hypothetical protein [Actinomadura sp. WMMA1423]|uniref:hypothetical protein n=1 Tax=Actinomadura sp. WMMA1423 TaxID=2591108 RepID=UPI0011474AB5|nr:hypothetical protein [Actinomadura sp. WMMA1423]